PPRPRLWPPSRPMADMCARSRLTASPPFRPATRASSDVNSCAVPLAWAALPPLLAISRCLPGSIDAKPRLLVFAMSVSFGVQSRYCVNCGACFEATEVGCTKGAHSRGWRWREEVDGGERGIRTLGRALRPYDGLANRWFKPLTHLSGAVRVQDGE